MRCPDCGARAKKMTGEQIYGNRTRSELRNKIFWACINFPTCNSYVGCHDGTDKPLGQMANRTLRKYRSQAHAFFDPLWEAKIRQLRKKHGRKYKGMKREARKAAYAWLADQLGIKYEDCHIGLMDKEQCMKVIEICGKYHKTTGKVQPYD